MLLLELMAGCGCPSFGDTEVTDPNDLASRDFLAEIRAGIADLAAWTGRDGVCVSELSVVAADDSRLEDTYVGRYFHSSGHVIISAGASSPRVVARHELCHALDALDGISDAHAEVFAGDDDTYADSASERFAHVCEQEPRDLAFAETFAPVCDLPAEGEMASLTLELALSAADADPGVAGTLPVEIVRHPVTLPAAGYSTALAANDGLGLAVETPSDGGAPTLLRVDGETGEPTELPLSLEAAPGVPYGLVTGGGEVFLLEHAAGNRMWRLDADTGELEGLAGPPGAGSAGTFSGAVVEGTIWWMNALASEPVLHTWDPSVGVEREVAWPDDPLAWLSDANAARTRLAANGHTVAIGTARGLALYDVVAGTWHVSEAPAATLLLWGLAGASDGRWVAYTPIVPWLFVNHSIPTLLVYDEVADAWLTPDDPCGSAAVDRLPDVGARRRERPDVGPRLRGTMDGTHVLLQAGRGVATLGGAHLRIWHQGETTASPPACPDSCESRPWRAGRACPRTRRRSTSRRGRRRCTRSTPCPGPGARSRPTR
jgi:hypothetical protein